MQLSLNDMIPYKLIETNTYKQVKLIVINLIQ